MPAASDPSTRGDVHPAATPDVSPYVAAASPKAVTVAPRMSSGMPRMLSARVSGTWLRATHTTAAAIGRLIRKISRHETASIR